MSDLSSFQGRTAVLTGGASGFGLEMGRLAARLGMNVVLVDVMAEALEAAAADVRALGGAGAVVAHRADVRHGAEIEGLGRAVQERFGAPHVVFNNAGVSAGGLVWEHSAQDWDWVMGVNLMGVAHGVRVFTPMMLAAERADPSFTGHVVNTASMAGLVNMPNMGAYNVSKHAVVSLSETLYQDLRLVSERVHAHVLCPYFVPTGIIHSDRARPADARAPGAPTRSQQVSQQFGERAVASGKVTAAEVAHGVFEALAERRFYIYSHPKALGPVTWRAEDIVAGQNPRDPYSARPELGEALRHALRG
jgi:NAD(P)-dependent dehydrogenase (short-subunit alcohol dehydrogenase family)